MPINAGPEYFKAEGKYNAATTIPEKIAGLEEMLRVGPNHKGTETLRAELKSKIAKLRAQLEKNRTTSKGKGSKYAVKREGAAQVILASMTNAGKSALLGAVTNAKPVVADYKFTTTKPEIGIMDYKGVQIQMIELPPIFEDFAYKGDGPTFFSIVRGSDLVIFLIDNTQNEKAQLDILHKEFENAQIKLNEKRSTLTLKKQGEGGIEYIGKKYLNFDIKEATKMLTEHGYHNAVITAYEYVTLEDLADVLNESVIYLPLVIVHTKADIIGDGISAETGYNLDKMKEQILKALHLIKVYTKTPGKDKDWPPVAMHEGDTIKTLARIIHKDFLKKFKYARIWGPSAKHPGQVVGLEHDLEDEDVIEIHVK
ncbi:TGS domain-containing protein [Candidatus Woesearchaeota archaeon]|nr:TGS domain-containing protein [Candidatus Woesearchaeota archaeon]